MRWTNKGHQFDDIAKVVCDDEHEYYIWGAGVFGESFYHVFKDEIRVKGFVDSNPKKWGATIGDVRVSSPQILVPKSAHVKVLVSAGWTKEIFGELERMGYSLNCDFFHIDEFSSIYMMYRHGRLCLTNISYIITEKCTLKCEKCSGLYPYYPEPIDYSLEQIESDLDTYFRWVDKVNVLGLVGGDAMVHPGFDAILSLVGQKYYGRAVSEIEIYTNAIIIPSRQTLELLRKYNVLYRFTDYARNVPERQHIDEVLELLRRYNIRFDHVRFRTWYDTGYPQKSNGIVGEDNLIRFFDACNRRSCQILTDKRVFYCGQAFNASRIDHCVAATDDYYSLEDNEPKKRMELLEFSLGYSEKGYLSYCGMCNGGQNVNEKEIEVGIQRNVKRTRKSSPL